MQMDRKPAGRGPLPWLAQLLAEHPESLGQRWRAAWDCRTPELFSDQGYSREQWARHVTWKRHLCVRCPRRPPLPGAGVMGLPPLHLQEDFVC